MNPLTAAIQAGFHPFVMAVRLLARVMFVHSENVSKLREELADLSENIADLAETIDGAEIELKVRPS